MLFRRYSSLESARNSDARPCSHIWRYVSRHASRRGGGAVEGGRRPFHNEKDEWEGGRSSEERRAGKIILLFHQRFARTRYYDIRIIDNRNMLLLPYRGIITSLTMSDSIVSFTARFENFPLRRNSPIIFASENSAIKVTNKETTNCKRVQ